jgi:hypothetical protein
MKEKNTMKTNFPQNRKIVTHEGGRAVRIDNLQQLRRSVMGCLLWEDTFYESGQEIATRIKDLIALLVSEGKAKEVAKLAFDARHRMNLRHAPLLMLSILAEQAKNFALSGFVYDTIARADELMEIVAIYWKVYGRKGIPKQLKKGIGLAFAKFNEYQLAKYDRQRDIRLIDIMRLTHPKPENEERSLLYNKIKTGSMDIPDTWEVSLSANDGVDKKTKWTRLLQANKLGGLALIRNLRNMAEAHVDPEFIINALNNMQVDRISPYRFIAAAREAPRFEQALEDAFFRSIATAGEFKLQGKTFLLVDGSGSMFSKMSGKSDMKRVDAAISLAVLLSGLCDHLIAGVFGDKYHEIPLRKGFSLGDAIRRKVDSNSGTYLMESMNQAEAKGLLTKDQRLIVITDGQTHDDVSFKGFDRVYVMNVGTYRNGIGYGNVVTHIDGFSSEVVRFIIEKELHG